MARQATESETRRETDRSRASRGTPPADRSEPGEPAVQPCLACGRSFPLIPAYHDGYGPVCPNCGCLI